MNKSLLSNYRSKVRSIIYTRSRKIIWAEKESRSNLIGRLLRIANALIPRLNRFAAIVNEEAGQTLDFPRCHRIKRHSCRKWIAPFPARPYIILTEIYSIRSQLSRSQLHPYPLHLSIHAANVRAADRIVCPSFSRRAVSSPICSPFEAKRCRRYDLSVLALLADWITFKYIFDNKTVEYALNVSNVALVSLDGIINRNFSANVKFIDAFVRCNETED